jgi:hypothetical protein
MTHRPHQIPHPPRRHPTRPPHNNPPPSQPSDHPTAEPNNTPREPTTTGTGTGTLTTTRPDTHSGRPPTSTPDTNTVPTPFPAINSPARDHTPRSASTVPINSNNSATVKPSSPARNDTATRAQLRSYSEADGACTTNATANGRGLWPTLAGESEGGGEPCRPA